LGRVEVEEAAKRPGLRDLPALSLHALHQPHNLVVVLLGAARVWGRVGATIGLEHVGEATLVQAALVLDLVVNDGGRGFDSVGVARVDTSSRRRA
jgi:hypothetical protein